MNKVRPLIRKISNLSFNGDVVVGSENFLVFTIENRNFVISISDLLEVRNPGKIIDLGKNQNVFEGVINVRGVIVAVFNPRPKMNLESDYVTSKKSRMLIFEFDNNFFAGIIVDDVEYSVKSGLVLKDTRPVSVLIEEKKFELFRPTDYLGKTELETLKEIIESF